jgi:hypothetical protein
VEAIGVWCDQPALHFGLPESETVAFGNPPQGLPELGQHEARTISQKLHNSVSTHIPGALYVQQVFAGPEFSERHTCHDPLGQIHDFTSSRFGLPARAASQ